MQDVIYVGIMIAFVAVAALFVVACDKIIGRDQSTSEDRTEEETDHDDEGVAA